MLPDYLVRDVSERTSGDKVKLRHLESELLVHFGACAPVVRGLIPGLRVLMLSIRVSAERTDPYASRRSCPLPRCESIR
jgi:hypothetical protein